MSDADPINGANPYEILGVSKTDTVASIEAAYESVIAEWRERMADASSEKNDDAYQDAVDALMAIEDAWKWIQENHEESPQLPDPRSLDGETPHEILGVTEGTSVRRMRSRRDELIEEYRRRIADARERNASEDYAKATRAIVAIEEASEALNLGGAISIPTGATGDTPRDILGIGAETSRSEAADRRRELHQEYISELSAELYEEDPWRFRELVQGIERVDDAWTTVREREVFPED